MASVTIATRWQSASQEKVSNMRLPKCLVGFACLEDRSVQQIGLADLDLP